MLTFDISGAQIDGARDYQEDAFLITHLGDADNEGGSLVIVADGMGGHAAGNVASNMAVQTFNKHVTSNFPHDNLPEVLRESVVQANNSISETVRETAALKGMGCTLVAAVLEDKFIRWVSVGDSHLYLVRKGEIKKKNADHSYGGFLDRMAAEGTPVEPEAGFSRNMLMSALTGEDIAEVDCPETPLELEPGDRVIVASDGLDTLSHGKVLSFAADADNAKACVDALLEGVDEAKMPRQDNTTVIVIDVGEKEEAPPVVAPPVEESVITELQDDAPQTDAHGFVVDKEADRKSSSGSGALIGVAVVVLLALAGGGYWYFTQGASEPEPFDVVEDDTESDAIEETMVEDETVADTDGDEPDSEPEASAPPVSEETPASEPETIAATTVTAGESFSDRLKSGGEGPSMIWIQGGRFSMGGRDSSANFDERPQRNVNVAGFAMSRYEITIAQYTKFARATGRKAPKTGALPADNHPVFFVSWNEALAYTKWLSDQTGKVYRIPTEAEWEYAARAGTDTAYWWGRRIGSDHAHCFACETGLDPRRPTKIGRFDPNPFGIFDIVGNIEEWVYDCYHPNYTGAPTDGTEFEGGDCSVRVVRGGAFSSGPKALRSAARSKFRYDAGNDSIGIRVVRNPD